MVTTVCAIRVVKGVVSERDTCPWFQVVEGLVWRWDTVPLMRYRLAPTGSSTVLTLSKNSIKFLMASPMQRWSHSTPKISEKYTKFSTVSQRRPSHSSPLKWIPGMTTSSNPYLRPQECLLLLNPLQSHTVDTTQELVIFHSSFPRNCPCCRPSQQLLSFFLPTLPFGMPSKRSNLCFAGGC